MLGRRRLLVLLCSQYFPYSSFQRSRHPTSQISSPSFDVLLEIISAEERAVQPVPINRNDCPAPFSQKWMCTTERESLESSLARPLDGSPEQKVIRPQLHEPASCIKTRSSALRSRYL